MNLLINEGDELPQWLERTVNCRALAAADLVVTISRDEGSRFGIYFADPDEPSRAMISVVDVREGASMEGAPTAVYNDPRIRPPREVLT